jgi:hypothetical protein
LLPRHRAWYSPCGMLVSRIRPAFSDSRRGTRTLVNSPGVSRTRRSFFGPWLARRTSDRAARQRHGLTTFGLRLLRYIRGLHRVLQSRYGAGLATSSPSEERLPGLLLAFIHRSAWKGCSPNFAWRGLYDVRLWGVLKIPLKTAAWPTGASWHRLDNWVASLVHGVGLRLRSSTPLEKRVVRGGEGLLRASAAQRCPCPTRNPSRAARNRSGRSTWGMWPQPGITASEPSRRRPTASLA